MRPTWTSPLHECRRGSHHDCPGHAPRYDAYGTFAVACGCSCHLTFTKTQEKP